MVGLDEQLDVNENVLWRDKPVKMAFFLPALGGVFFALFFLAFASIWLVAGVPLLASPIVIAIPAAIILGIFIPLWQYLRGQRSEYVITDKRVIIRSGAIGRSFRFIELGKIQEAHVKIGLVDRWFKTGSIIILTATSALTSGNIGGDLIAWKGGPLPHIIPNISTIRKPYDVQKIIQDAIQDYKLKS